jgi:alpha-tubulin suppressor-like RCC1 family protein
MSDRLAPIAVSGGLQWQSVSARFGGYTCGRSIANLAYCWGTSPAGFGNGPGTQSSSNVPIVAGSGFNYNNVSAGQQTCGVRADNVGLCWGFDFVTGSGPVETPFAAVPAVSFGSISAGFNHSCGLSLTGLAHCWGSNFAGQLGDGTTAGAGPTPVIGGLTFTRITVGALHTCGVTPTGQAYCWGDNEFGQLGNGNAGGSMHTPVAVAGGLTLKDISAGVDHTCAVSTGDVAYCWGYASNLGAGIPPVRFSPTIVVFQ